MYNKDSDVRTGVSWRCTRRNCNSRFILKMTNTGVLNEVNHNHEHKKHA
jgi:hypothetical protein